jgi:hypothetical protein
VGLGLVAGGVYLVYEYYRKNGLNQMGSLDARNQWEMMGYLNGLIRGAGNAADAMLRLTDWEQYWIEQRPELIDVIEEWYDYGRSRVTVLYGV